ncbi:glucocorticoid receptor isoform X2 [Lepisosteus oculatus]|nr:PREDICTED: glucocorticoid receptor isoform X2 [Lepisosteus oculatus]XP_015204943.1 PREDICTED: glucocorticoid receptor isoform X2 [Lepisosteus oculatus]XP_015204944.1 PREDICTED: glucocorticoid receptor isoform X2 [Lepisosteus oculatus]
MEQGGLHQSNNRDESVKFVEYSGRGEGAFGGGGSTMAASTTSTVAQPSPRIPPVPGDITNGLGTSAPQQELTTAVSASMGLYMEETDSKVAGNDLKLQQQQTPSSFMLGETNFSLLEESIANLNRSSTSADALPSGSDPFSLKAEDFTAMDKSELDLEQDSFGQGEKDSDINPRLFGEDQNTLDILQELDLPGSPKGEMNGSPWNFTEFYDGDEAALLTSLATDETFLMDVNTSKDTKPVVNNSNCTGVNGTDQQMLDQSTPLASVKMEKESYIQLCTPGVIKQETADRKYCQMSGAVPDLPGPVSSPISICGVSTSSGQSYHYGVNASPTLNLQQQDQKPVFNLYPSLAAVGDSWNRGQTFGDAAGMQRGSETFAGAPGFSANYAGSTSRADPSTPSPVPSKASGPAHKICLVCSDEASGCHYGVLTCGSCKVFFKRAVEGWRARQNADGQHNYLCAGRNDCIIDKIRRKNCPACRFRKCLQAGMNLEARKTKKLNRLKGPGRAVEQPVSLPDEQTRAVVPKSMPQLIPTMLSLLKAIEPEIIYSGYDSTIPDTSTRLMSTLNSLGGRQVVSAVKWAKALPGFRNLHLDDQMTLLQCSWMFLMSFGLGWRSYQQSNGSMLCFAPDLVINEERMKLPYMSEQCEQMLKISNEFVRLQVSYDEYLCMKVLLLLSTVPKTGLRSQSIFDEIRMSYIKELGKAIVKREENSSQNWQRFYQLTKLLDSMHELVGGLLNFCFYTFLNKSLCVEFPEMLSEIISNQLPKFRAGSVKPLLFHQK